ncbi:ABC transporter permease [Nocardioides pocheonensis]|uniref:ABC transporter permease n=1 Tax=Nocardioides pocheonensis TaxID=661485 RepID=A0A3N0GMR5_9ACTN|nr:ABC transporter permease [Nocardioides pocheonensis]RNM13516.1 ABC transporter permease [Nocardioides pocheonensis]
MTTTVAAPAPAPDREANHTGSKARTYFLIGLAVLFSLAAVRVITGVHEVDSQGSLRAAIVATCPILLAALGGLWSERSGVVNIGLEGQMLLGTWGGAFFTYYYGPWVGLLGAIGFGVLGGLLHGLATVTFGVDHIVSGVALNLIAVGLTTFLAEAFFADLDSQFGHGGAQQLTGLQKPTVITIPGVSDAATSLADKHWFAISDVAALVAAVTNRISVVTILVFVLVFATGWILWRTRFGLRLRSCGENPEAAESLGINVIRHKYAAVLVSGGLAGLGGGYLALVSSPGFHTNQSNGRGYIGLAAMIFGNWRPGGALIGSGLFGYTDSLRLRDPATIHAMLLFVGFWLLLFAAWRIYKARRTQGIVLGVFGLLFLLWFAVTDEVPRDFTSMTPYVTTLLVLAFASQRLRMPKADGKIYRKGTVD